MTFNAVIDKIMPDVQSGSNEPFIVFRDKNGDWNCDFTKNADGETFDWVEDVKKIDPFAVTLTGFDLANGSFPYVYDRILNERLRTEYENAVFTNTDLNELKALINLVEENMGEFSSEVTDYLTMFDKPLTALYEMTSVSLVSDNPDDDYNYDKIGDFVDAIENEVSDRLKNRKKDEIPKGLEGSEKSDKRNIEGYEELNSVQVNGRLMFVGENKEAEYRYMVAELKRDNPLGIMESEWAGMTGDYLEALDKFRYLIEYNINVVQSDRDVRKSLYGVEPLTLTASECVKGGLDDDLTGKLIIIKPEVLSPEYRRADYQLRVCTGGFGANPDSRGNAVFCTELFIGKESRFERYDVLGVADINKIPQWAVDRLNEYHKKGELGVSTGVIQKGDNDTTEIPLATPMKKPTLQEKLDSAKEKARKTDAKNNNRGDKPPKRDERG